MKMKKVLAMLLAILMIVTATIAGTIAWLQVKTQEVKNTFSPATINITLTETDADSDNDANENSYKMVPGATITKDPKVTVVAGSEACYVFVKVVKSANYDTYLDNYAVVTEGEKAWTALAGQDGVFYRVVDAETAKIGVELPVLKDNQVTVKTGVTKADMEAIDGVVAAGAAEGAAAAELALRPTLTFTAYAIQQTGFDSAAAAWTEAQKLG